MQQFAGERRKTNKQNDSKETRQCNAWPCFSNRSSIFFTLTFLGMKGMKGQEITHEISALRIQ